MSLRIPIPWALPQVCNTVLRPPEFEFRKVILLGYEHKFLLSMYLLRIRMYSTYTCSFSELLIFLVISIEFRFNLQLSPIAIVFRMS